jgi:hypothetical protein
MIIYYEKNVNGCIKDESPVDAGLKNFLPRYQLDRPNEICFLLYITGSNLNQAFISEKLTFLEVFALLIIWKSNINVSIVEKTKARISRPSLYYLHKCKKIMNSSILASHAIKCNSSMRCYV